MFGGTRSGNHHFAQDTDMNEQALLPLMSPLRLLLQHWLVSVVFSQELEPAYAAPERALGASVSARVQRESLKRLSAVV